MFVAQGAQPLHEFGWHGGHAALTLHGLDQNGAGLRPDQRPDGVEIARRGMLEAGHGRAEAFQIARIAARCDGAQGPAMEGAGKGDDFVAIHLALGPEIGPRGLDRAFKRLGARIGEEHRIREGGIDQALGQPLLLGNGKDIGGVPDLVGGAFECRDEMRVAMPQGIDGNAGMEIEIVAALLVVKAHAFAPLKGEFGAGIGAKERRHGSQSF